MHCYPNGWSYIGYDITDNPSYLERRILTTDHRQLALESSDYTSGQLSLSRGLKTFSIGPNSNIFLLNNEDALRACVSTVKTRLFRFSWKWRRRSPRKVKRERMKKQRKQYAPEEKVAILRRHLLEKVPISELCDKQGLQPTVFYRWQKEFFENGAAAFEKRARPNHSAEHERIGYLEKKIQTKDEVLAELMAEQ